MTIGRQTRSQKQRGNVALMACVFDTCDTDTYVNAQGVPEWENVMTVEIDSLKKNKTWELFPQLQGKNVVKCGCVYKTMFTSVDVVEHHKDCLVTKAFFQQEGIDYTETFAPLMKMNSI